MADLCRQAAPVSQTRLAIPKSHRSVVVGSFGKCRLSRRNGWENGRLDLKCAASEYTVFSSNSSGGDEGSVEIPSDMLQEPTSSRLSAQLNGASTSSDSDSDSTTSSTPSPPASSSLSLATASPSSANSGNSRSGLFRSPISGGVQSATSAHGLPTPAVAVRNLVEQARFAHLCTVMSRMHHRRKGYPFGSLVDFAADPDGHPVFLLSPLAIHTRNLMMDPRCTMVVQTPGWSGLANARATLFGDVYPLPYEQQEWAQQLYSRRHHHAASQQWGNFHFYRMDTICDIHFVGGFGTVGWVDVKEYAAARPDVLAADNTEVTLQDLNRRLGADLKQLLASFSEEVDDASFISIDSRGVDIRVRQGAQFIVQRLPFDGSAAVASLAEGEAALRRVLRKGVAPTANGFQR